jgi:S-adenosyl-L-methionine hydrolase (adenosine-forming)
VSRAETISFLSDYGLADEFVGVVKSVLRQLAPHATVVDITHDVPAHDVRAGALALARSSQYLAPGVVLAVVDPGVGTDRRAVAVEAEENGLTFVGPDNGLLAAAVSMVGGARRAVELTNEDLHLASPGPTFAGRDVFAPVAARLANGLEITEAGPEIDPFTLTPGLIPVTRVDEGTLVAEVLWVDRFGNAQLNVDPDELADYGERIRIRWADQSRTGRRAATYGDLKMGEVGLVVDSYGLVSICLDRRSAAAELKLRPGTAVSLDAPVDS